MRHDFAADSAAHSAYRRLLRDVLGVDPGPSAPAESWSPAAYFTPDGRCVAALDIGRLTLVLDGTRHAAGAVRSVATHPDWRGRGLFRSLMDKALEGFGTAIALLYTETPTLYAPFGFHPLAQQSFVGPLPPARRRSPGRRMDVKCEADRRLILDLAARRAPVSSRCALLVDAPLTLANLAADEALTLVHDPEQDIVLACELDGDEIVIADVIAPQMPSIHTLAGLLPAQPEATRLRCRFTPDALGWCGTPEAEDTGLMIRGPLPAAMTRPFMFPPTCEF